MTNSIVGICPCCGSIITFVSDGIQTWSIPENPIMNTSSSLATNQIMQTQNTNCSISDLINSMINKGE